MPLDPILVYLKKLFFASSPKFKNLIPLKYFRIKTVKVWIKMDEKNSEKPFGSFVLSLYINKNWGKLDNSKMSN